MAKRKKDFGVDGVYSEHRVTAQLREAREEARKLIDAGFFAKITKVRESVPRGERIFYVVWQRGKMGLKGRAAFAALDRVFGKQERVF